MEQGILYNKYIQVLLILRILVPEGAALFPDQYQDNASALFSYKLLSTRFCNRKTLNMSDTCPTPNNLDLLINNCRFECPAEEKPVCVNTQQRGSAYVCLPKNLTCEKGVRRIGWVDKDFQNLIVREEICPTGTFQAYKSDCFQACTAVHAPLKNIPEKYKVFSEGDSMSPTYVYCNYLKGYFNTRNRTLLNYDQDSMHNPHFCQHVDVSNPCEKGKIVLGNGTCVFPCAPGMCRDDRDDFICKFNCSAGDSNNAIVTTIPVTTQQNDVKTTSQMGEAENEENGKEKDEKGVGNTVVIVTIVGGVVIILTVLIGTFYLRKKSRSQKKGPLKVKTNKKYENNRTVIKIQNGNVYYNAKSKDPTEHLQRNILDGDNNETPTVEMQELKPFKAFDGEIAENEETAVKMPI